MQYDQGDTIEACKTVERMTVPVTTRSLASDLSMGSIAHVLRRLERQPKPNSPRHLERVMWLPYTSRTMRYAVGYRTDRTEINCSSLRAMG